MAQVAVPAVELRLDHVSIEVPDFADAVGRLDEQFGAELFDGLGITVGHLTLLGQFMGAPLPFIGPFRITPQEVEVQGSEDQCARGEQSRAKSYQPPPRSIPCRLEWQSLG